MEILRPVDGCGQGTRLFHWWELSLSLKAIVYYGTGQVSDGSLTFHIGYSIDLFKD